MSEEINSTSVKLDRPFSQFCGQTLKNNINHGQEDASMQIPAASYHAIVPVYNEADLLEDILTRIQSAGYLYNITFVNDASTDESKDILDRWQTEQGIDVIHLTENRKKEGAIHKVLETLQQENRLPEKVILLDADSFLLPKNPAETIADSLDKAVAYMDEADLAAMGFRYDIYLPEKPSLLQKAQYAEFAGLRFMNRVSPDQYQMWVINGRGGIFRSDILLDVLRQIEPDFETGDILITQKMMKNGHKIAYYDDIKVETMDVNTIKEFSISRDVAGRVAQPR